MSFSKLRLNVTPDLPAETCLCLQMRSWTFSVFFAATAPCTRSTVQTILFDFTDAWGQPEDDAVTSPG